MPALLEKTAKERDGRRFYGDGMKYPVTWNIFIGMNV